MHTRTHGPSFDATLSGHRRASRHRAAWAADRPGPRLARESSRRVELTTRHIREDRVGSLPELENDVLYLWLMVFAGHEVAARASQAERHARLSG